ncbi:MAG: hypothetical protein GX995_00920, partial [Clostridiales bacterium]|nr:hypothetical protein [Clostridiales bacterium]
LTGITNKMLEGARATTEVLTDFDAFLSDDIIVGHNVNFDVNFQMLDRLKADSN